MKVCQQSEQVGSQISNHGFVTAALIQLDGKNKSLICFHLKSLVLSGGNTDAWLIVISTITQSL